MDHDMREELMEHFEHTIGRPPTGTQERVLAGFRASVDRSPRRRLEWAGTVAAIVLALLVVGVLVLSRLGPQLQPAGQQEIPEPRSGAAVAYDPGRHVLVLFGGTTDGVTSLDDTWTWDGAHWTRLHPAASPAQQAGSSGVTPGGGSKRAAFTPLIMAYDEADRTLVLYGAPGSTWTWDGRTWRPHAGMAAPNGAVAMAYDPASKAVLLYLAPAGGMSQTWRWDGAAWTQLQPRTTPDVVMGAMAFDGRHLLLFGSPFGLVQGQHLTRTWAWDGVDWSPLSAAVGLPPDDYAAAYDQARGRLVVLTGGSETWLWDGTTWTRVHPPNKPPARSGAAAWYDTRAGLVGLYGGRSGGRTVLGDVWAWDGTDWRMVEETKR